MTGNDPTIRTHAQLTPPLARLAESLDHEIDLLQRLDALSRRQSAMVDSPEAGAVLGILRERETLVASIRDADEQAERLKREVRGHEPRPGFGAEIDARIARVAAMLDAISRRDRDDRRRLEEQRAGIVAEMRSLAARQTAGRAYAPAGATPPRFEDRHA